MSTTHARRELADFSELAPGAVAALRALGQAAVEGGLERDLLELVKIRASQINGCAFCVQYHLTLARNLGVSGEKLDLLVVWRDAGVFSSREMAALAWTELLTRITPEGVPDAAYAAALAEFGDARLALLSAAIGAINAWNRLAIAYCFTPPVPR